MLTLLSMLGGGLLRFLPFMVEFFKQKHEAEHEFRMAELQLKIDQARAAQQIDLAHAQAEIATTAGELQAWNSGIESQGKPTGVPWVDAVSATVRPFLTYYWCVGLYGAGKAIQVVVAFNTGTPLAGYVEILITEFDQQVIGSMLAFWFVDRSLRKMSGK